jgi:hypothetical protein
MLGKVFAAAVKIVTTTKASRTIRILAIRPSSVLIVSLNDLKMPESGFRETLNDHKTGVSIARRRADL